MSQDGSKKGANIQEASLADFPRASRNQRFTFETAAQATKSGYIYASLSWGFRIRDAAKGVIDQEFARVNNVQTTTFDAAVKAFNEFYKNPGTPGAP